MSRPRTVQLIALLCCAGFVGAAATRIPSINEGRKELNIMGAESPHENAPPEFAFLIQAFGAFRGLITDIAFIRAEEYKNQGRFYDAMQLHKWICALQPHFPLVWEYAAWNMSWNISVTTYTPEERWNWVYNGVKLIRDQGIPFNPRAVNLYKQLAWTFNNKMGEVTDEFHYTYKCNWAWRMHLLLGPPPQPLSGVDLETLADELTAEADFGTFMAAARKTFVQNEKKRQDHAKLRWEEYRIRSLDEVTGTGEARKDAAFELAQQAALERIRRIDAAPEKLAEVYAEHPEARRMVAELRKLGIILSDDTLSEDAYWRSGGLAFTFFAPYRKLKEPTGTLDRVARRDPDAEPRAPGPGEQIDAILGVRAGNPAGEALVRWLQRKVLSNVYKLETAHMMRVIEDFGPVDWRVPDSQSLYWVTRGLVSAQETINEFGNDKTNTARIMFFSLRNLLLRNRIIFEPNPEAIHLSYLNVGRDLNFIEPMHQAYLKYGPLFDPKGGDRGEAGNTFRTGHINFLNEAIRLLYLSGREAEAGHYYSYLQNAYRTNAGGEPNPVFNKTLDDYVMDDFRYMMDNPGLRESRLALDGLMYNAYSELAGGDVTRYAHIVKRARELRTEFMKDKNTGRRMEDRISLKPFIDIQTDTLRRWLEMPSVVQFQAIKKVRLWRAVPLHLKWRVYDQVLPALQAECEAWDLDLAKAFPEPKDMDQYRQQHGDRFEEERQTEAETLPQTNE
ncbi:MAG: hypothetical protein KAY37_09705 [Phycisphaerae bacterium]|nr:hypothetical protein [Phycisphaerae bacterium]